MGNESWEGYAKTPFADDLCQKQNTLTPGFLKSHFILLRERRVFSLNSLLLILRVAESKKIGEQLSQRTQRYHGVAENFIDIDNCFLASK
jgi:hypothetical protein